MTWVKVVEVGHGNLDTLWVKNWQFLDEREREREKRVKGDIQFSNSIPGKIELSLHLAEIQVLGEDHDLAIGYVKFSKPIRHLSGDVELDIHVWSTGEKSFELEEKLGSHQWIDTIWIRLFRWELGWEGMNIVREKRSMKWALKLSFSITQFCQRG